MADGRTGQLVEAGGVEWCEPHNGVMHEDRAVCDMSGDTTDACVTFPLFWFRPVLAAEECPADVDGGHIFERGRCTQCGGLRPFPGEVQD